MKIKKSGYTLDISDELVSDDEYTKYELACKGYYFNLKVTLESGESYLINVYDPERYYDDIKQEIEENGYFYEKNAILVKEISFSNVISVTEYLYKNNLFKQMLPEDK